MYLVSGKIGNTDELPPFNNLHKRSIYIRRDAMTLFSSANQFVVNEAGFLAIKQIRHVSRLYTKIWIQKVKGLGQGHSAQFAKDSF